MNGIVHPCTHPEGKVRSLPHLPADHSAEQASTAQPAPKNEEEMMNEIFLYTDRVVSMVRPRKLLVMAIDGVAPRAKMNQQRSRRFRSAQEAKTKEEDRIAAIAEWEGAWSFVGEVQREADGVLCEQLWARTSRTSSGTRRDGTRTPSHLERRSWTSSPSHCATGLRRS